MNTRTGVCRGKARDEWIPCVHVRCDTCWMLLHCTNCGTLTKGYARGNTVTCGDCYLLDVPEVNLDQIAKAS